MILARACFCGFAAMTAAWCAPAEADVMELGADGARWVAGGSAGLVNVAAANPTSQSAQESVVVGDVAVPAAAISNASNHIAGVPVRYVRKVRELSLRYNLSPSLIEALVWQESRWRENAVSHAGARGLAQLMPGTAKYLGVNPDDPMQNLEGGARYLREQLNRFDGNLEHALAAYNAGPGRVMRAGGVPNIRETRHYVAAIMGRLASHSKVQVQ